MDFSQLAIALEFFHVDLDMDTDSSRSMLIDAIKAGDLDKGVLESQYRIAMMFPNQLELEELIGVKNALGYLPKAISTSELLEYYLADVLWPEEYLNARQREILAHVVANILRHSGKDSLLSEEVRKELLLNPEWHSLKPWHLRKINLTSVGLFGYLDENGNFCIKQICSN